MTNRPVSWPEFDRAMPRKRIIVMGLTAVLVCAATPLRAQAVKPPTTSVAAGSKVVVEGAWARFTPGRARTGAAFMSITAKGPAEDRLLAVRSIVAEHVELHTHIMEGGIARMRRIEMVAIAAGGTTELKPGGSHVMLLGVHTPPPAVGSKLALTLVFERAGEVRVEAEVRAIGGMGHGSHHGTGHGMGPASPRGSHHGSGQGTGTRKP